SSTYVSICHDYNSYTVRHDRVTKQRAKNEGGRAKPKRPLFIGFTGFGPPQRLFAISPRRPSPGPLEHTFAYIVGPWLHSLVASSCPLNNEFHIPSSLGKLTTACLV
ncbi:hypothetical protein ALC60_12528, partial [Trachymyrmex zeteki]